MHELDEKTLKALLLESIRDEWIDILNLMGKGDIYQLSFGEIVSYAYTFQEVRQELGKLQEILSSLGLINLQLGL